MSNLLNIHFHRTQFYDRVQEVDEAIQVKRNKNQIEEQKLDKLRSQGNLGVKLMVKKNHSLFKQKHLCPQLKSTR